MLFKEFTMPVTGKGNVHVSFIIDTVDDVVKVREIKLRSDFKSSLPHHPRLVEEKGQWKFYIEKPLLMNNEIDIVPQYLDDDLSMEIIERILAIKNEEVA